MYPDKLRSYARAELVLPSTYVFAIELSPRKMKFSKSKLSACVAALLALEVAAKIYNDPTPKQRRFDRRQVPANATDVKTITSPTGVKIRYKEPGKAGVCE